MKIDFLGGMDTLCEDFVLTLVPTERIHYREGNQQLG